jgi:16S rRNA (cytidine1402-2'-O)-methyltransferase
VTDAGTPAISDPGADLVSAWAAEGGRVVPIPGASAVLAAVAASGIAGPRWAFEGFLPRSGRDRRERLAAIAGDPRGTVLFEAPGRVAATLRDLAVACGDERTGAVGRELTKLHEQIERGTLGSLAAAVAEGRIPSRGEFVLVVGMGQPTPATGNAGDVEAAERPSSDSSARVSLAGRRHDAWPRTPVCHGDSCTARVMTRAKAPSPPVRPVPPLRPVAARRRVAA